MYCTSLSGTVGACVGLIQLPAECSSHLDRPLTSTSHIAAITAICTALLWPRCLHCLQLQLCPLFGDDSLSPSTRTRRPPTSICTAIVTRPNGIIVDNSRRSLTTRVLHCASALPLSCDVSEPPPLLFVHLPHCIVQHVGHPRPESVQGVWTGVCCRRKIHRHERAGTRCIWYRLVCECYQLGAGLNSALRCTVTCDC